MIGGGIDKVLQAANIISDVRQAFEKIQNLETAQRSLADSFLSLDTRVRELEAGLREAKAEIKLASVEAAQATVNGAQGQIYQRMVDLEIKVSKLSDNVQKVVALPDPGADKLPGNGSSQS